jgi:hypothetical protein
MNADTLEDLSYLHDELSDVIHDLSHALEEIEGVGLARENLQLAISYAQTALMFLGRVIE